MLLTPHYGADPLLVIDGDPAEIATPTIRQRQRLAAVLKDLTDDQWASTSRCDGWSSRDVVIHLDSTNFFWTQSIAAGRRGEPSRFLATFDPVTSPSELVAQSQALSSGEVLDRFVESTATLAAMIESVAADEWNALGEAPPGHVSISAVTHHALWDSWIHERDILIPLGIAPACEPDEIEASLRYVAALGPALSLTRERTENGCFDVRATDPEISFTVEISDQVRVVGERTEATGFTLTGDAVNLIDALSVRRPLDQDVPDGGAWMLGGLVEVFDG